MDEGSVTRQSEVHPSSQRHFDAIYEAAPDPWSFATSHYELERYRTIIAMLGDRVYERAFEPGCSIGVLTEMLAPHCRHVLATDVSPVAVARAGERCARFAHVTARAGRLPDDLPDEPGDLVVFSEIGYYFEHQELRTVIDRLATCLLPHGVLVAVHWTGISQDHQLSGHQVHRELTADPRLRTLHSEDHPSYLAAKFARC